MDNPMTSENSPRKKPKKEVKPKTKDTHIFTKKGKVSVWVSQHPYKDIPDEYFEEAFSKNNTRAKNTWSKNYKLAYFNPDNMETNGAQSGVVDIEKAAGECSFSSSFMSVLLSKARKKKTQEITWIILLFDYEYSVKISEVSKDTHTLFLGAFDYEYGADSLYEIEEH